MMMMKNIGNVFKLSGVAFRLAPPDGGLLVRENALCDDLRRPVSVVRHKVRQSYILRTICSESPSFTRTSIHPLLYTSTGSDVTTYFRSEVIAKTTVEMPPLTASGGISSERLVRPTKYYRLIGDNRPHKPAGYDITRCFRSSAKRI